MIDAIKIRGAREGGLQGIDMDLALGSAICLIGRCGSGSRALAVDVLLAESRRRYMQALSPGEREGIAGVVEADVDEVTGLPPAIYLGDERRGGSLGAYLQLDRTLAQIYQVKGQMHCVDCGGGCHGFAADEVEGEAARTFPGARCLVLAPLAWSEDADWPSIWRELRQAGFLRLMVDGEIVRIEGEAVEISQGEDRVYVVVDRLVPTSERNVRFTEAVRVARSISSGRTKVWDSESGSALNLNQQPTCGQCGRQYQELATIDFFAKTTEGIAHKVLLEGKSLAELEAMPLAGLRDFVEHVEVGESFAETLEEACAVGLGRLSLGRSLDSLSGGEWQRLQLVSCISGGLTGILYIFDGLGSQLHPEILPQVVAGVRRLVDRGNTALLLDHAPEIVAGADRVCEFVGGKAVDRTVEWRDVSYVDLVSKQEEILDRGPILTVRGEGPLGKLDIKIPHGALTYVGGPSGSGKTRFLREVIWPLLKGRKSDYEVSGAGGNVRVVEIGTSRREKTLLANLGVFARIADLYAASPVAQERGLGRDAFQLDKPGGRCPSCEGRGQLYFDMDFLEDISLVCAACDGRRFREEIQEVTLRGASIADVLEMGVERARSHFARESKLRDHFNAAVECGLGHLRTGQNPGELERGEWLRLCLALEWNRASARDWLLLDHPSCGDHPADVQSMIEILRGLVAKGATIVVADHWPPVQQAADWSVHMAS